MNDINQTPTVESVSIRAERQRERAEKWRKRAETREREISEIRATHEAEQQKLAEQQQLALAEACTDLHAQVARLTKANTEERNAVYQAARRADEKYREGRDSGRTEILERYARAIRLGEAELNRRYEERVESRIQQLLDGPLFDADGELVDWVRKSIKTSHPTHLIVEVVDGKLAKYAPRVTGHGAYHTTPSGKTVVDHPRAYGHSTVYHCSTEKLVVGRTWIEKFSRHLADIEARKRIKR